MNIRNGKFPFTASALTAAIMVSACGGDGSLGGGDTAGIGGSGFISSGTVTGFGSVYVNGVRFETDSSTIFDVEDNIDATQADLRVGMVVQVEGTIISNSAGIATGIQYSDDIEGPISAIPGKADIFENLDATEKTFSIMGKTIVVSRADTAFEGSNFTYDSIALDNVIEISGFYDQRGDLRASYVERKSLNFDPDNILEIKGTAVWTGSNFKVQGINIDLASPTYFDLVNGLQDGLLVEVKGTYDSSTNTIIATEIDAESNDLNDEASKVELEGIITEYASGSEFKINGLTVNASSAVFTPTTLQLKDGVKVEVEGTMLDGVLIAMEVEVRGGSAEVSAPVGSTIDTINNSFTVELAGQSITVQLTAATRIEDDIGIEDDYIALINDLKEGDFVDVRGFESATNTITATQIKREQEVKDIELQGVVRMQDPNTSITVLGVTFPVDIFTTIYENESDESVSTHSLFIDLTTNDSTVIKIVDKKDGEGNGQDVADEVEIED